MILYCGFPQVEMKTVDVNREMDEILKETQEITPEGDHTSNTMNPKLTTRKLAVQETLLSLLRQLIYSRKLWQSMVQIVVDRQMLQSFHLSQIPIQDLLTMSTSMKFWKI